MATVKEYLSSSDLKEVVNTIQELQQPHLAHIFVKQVNIYVIQFNCSFNIMDQGHC